MNKIDLPQELKKKRKFALIKRLSLCAFLVGLIVLVIIFFPNLILPADEGLLAVKIIIYIALFLLSFYISGVPLKLIDKSWHGTIQKVDLVSKTGTYMVGIKPFPYTKIDVVLTVQKSDGKLLKHTAMSYSIKEQSNQNLPNVFEVSYNPDTYKAGDEVYKFYGFKHLYTVSERNKSFNRCISCGSENNCTDATCWKCGARLL